MEHTPSGKLGQCSPPEPALGSGFRSSSRDGKLVGLSPPTGVDGRGIKMGSSRPYFAMQWQSFGMCFVPAYRFGVQMDPPA